MKVETGRQAVWQHAKELGMDEKIAQIAKMFDVKDVSIIGNGKMTYTHERPRKMYRVPAVPTGKSDMSTELAKIRETSSRKRLKGN